MKNMSDRYEHVVKILEKNHGYTKSIVEDMNDDELREYRGKIKSMYVSMFLK